MPKPAVAVSIGRLPETIVVHYGPIDSVRMGAVKLVEMLRLQVMSVGQLAQGEGADQIAGPVGSRSRRAPPCARVFAPWSTSLRSSASPWAS